MRPVSLPFLWMEAFHFDSHLLRGNTNAVRPKAGIVPRVSTPLGEPL